MFKKVVLYVSLFLSLAVVSNAQAQDQVRNTGPLAETEIAAFIEVFSQASPSAATIKSIDPARLALVATRLGSIYIYRGQYLDETELIRILTVLKDPGPVTTQEFALYQAQESQLTPIMEKFIGAYTMRLGEDGVPMDLPEGVSSDGNLTGTPYLGGSSEPEASSAPTSTTAATIDPIDTPEASQPSAAAPSSGTEPEPATLPPAPATVAPSTATETETATETATETKDKTFVRSAERTDVDDDPEANEHEDDEPENHDLPAENPSEDGGARTKCSGKEDEYTADFEEFWQIYPRHVAKKPAYVAWKVLKRDKTLDIELVAQAAKTYVEAMRALGKEEAYMLHARTFLSKDRWREWLKPDGAAYLDAVKQYRDSENRKRGSPLLPLSREERERQSQRDRESEEHFRREQERLEREFGGDYHDSD
jgi:hypothetical protein